MWVWVWICQGESVCVHVHVFMKEGVFVLICVCALVRVLVSVCIMCLNSLCVWAFICSLPRLLHIFLFLSHPACPHPSYVTWPPSSCNLPPPTLVMADGCNIDPNEVFYSIPQGVKSEHQGEWYRRMFDSLHKVKDGKLINKFWFLTIKLFISDVYTYTYSSVHKLASFSILSAHEGLHCI